jgi:hypothetical protein
VHYTIPTNFGKLRYGLCARKSCHHERVGQVCRLVLLTWFACTLWFQD